MPENAVYTEGSSFSQKPCENCFRKAFLSVEITNSFISNLSAVAARLFQN
jgi:hypothetical protein